MTDTLLLRALAALLIVNSHLEGYYPVRQLAADGLLGDSLFFLLSGFGLAMSETRTKRPFHEWFGRRLSRLYPSLVLAVIVFDCILAGGCRSWTPADLFLNLAWGRSYPFVGQILTFYVVFFVLLRFDNPRVFPLLTAVLFVPYAAIPFLGRGDVLFHAFHWLYYFQMMLFGAWLAQRPRSDGEGSARPGTRLAILGLVYVSVRLAIGTPALRDWFFLPHLFVFPVALVLLELTRSKGVAGFFRDRAWASRPVAFIGGLTLEVYLMHYQVLRVEAIRTLVFPWNIVVFVAVSMVLASTLARAAEFVRSAARLRPADARSSRPGARPDRRAGSPHWSRLPGRPDSVSGGAPRAPGGELTGRQEGRDEAGGGSDGLHVLSSNRP